jgi:prepilin-type N-terminal cleavage/methylation domain-containing protein
MKLHSSATPYDDGFTLVEVLIGLVLLALMTVVLAEAFGGLHQSQRLHNLRAREASVEPVETYLRRALVGLRPIRFMDGPASAPLLDARADRLTFISSHSPAGIYAGLYRVTWALVESELAGQFDLEERRVLHRPNTSDTDREQRTRLLKGIHAVTFRYFGAVPAAAPPVWREIWTSPAPPRLIAVEVLFPSSDPRRWHGVTVAVPTGG